MNPEFKQLEKPFFLVWNPHGPHKPKKRYKDIKKAEADAKLLAEENPGGEQRFHVCVVLGYYHTHKVVETVNKE